MSPLLSAVIAGAVLGLPALILYIAEDRRHVTPGDMDALITATREPPCPDCGGDPCRIHDGMYWAVLERKEFGP